ncbi:MAG TPA: hypothetical protein VF147_02190 [Vicinamibacterales bacterium]
MAAAGVLAVYAVAVWLSGGFDLRVAGMRLRSHEWARPAVVALVCAALGVWSDRSRVVAILERAWVRLDSPGVPRFVTMLALIWTLAAAFVYSTGAVGGADSYGYAGQAKLFAQGRLVDRVPLSPAFTWPDAETTLRPLGFTQGRAPGEISPIYPPGLPMMLAPLMWFGERAIYLVVPAFGLSLVWGTYRVGVHLGDPLAGGVASLLVSASPTFLFQLVQPMSDVPAAACWLGALLLGARATSIASLGAGVMTALAILIRPNLAPLAILVAIPLLRPRAGIVPRLSAFAAPLVAGVLLLGWIQAVRYGSPLASGYGTLGDAFALANIAPNLARYPAWLTTTHTPFLWLWLLAPAWFARRPAVRPFALVIFMFVVAVWCAYLPYVYFQPDEWFYTRFLLPALPLMLVFATVVALSVLRRLPTLFRPVAVVCLATALCIALIGSASKHGAFEMRAQEQKYPRAGAYVRDELPQGAFVFAMQHSGSIRYYADRATIRWDMLDANSLDACIATLRALGHEPFAVVDKGEDPVFRQKFEAAGQRAIHRLMPIAELGDARVYRFEQ